MNHEIEIQNDGDVVMAAYEYPYAMEFILPPEALADNQNPNHNQDMNNNQNNQPRQQNNDDVNQFYTHVYVIAEVNGVQQRIKHFDDLQEAYLDIKHEIQDDLRNGDWIRPWERVVQRSIECHHNGRRGYNFARWRQYSYFVYYDVDD